MLNLIQRAFKRLHIYRRLRMLDAHVTALQQADDQIKNSVAAINTRVTAILNKVNTAIDEEDEAAIDGVRDDLQELKTKLDAIAPATDDATDTNAQPDQPVAA